MPNSKHSSGSLPLRYRLLLRLLPAHVRDEHRRELEDDLGVEAPGIGAFAADITRASLGAHWDVLRQDVAIALRQIRRAPTFALVAGGTLALGIGGNVAFFALVDAVLVRQLSFAGADRIVDVTEENIGRGMRSFGISPANFKDVVADTAVYEAAAMYQSRSGTVRVGDDRERVSYSAVGGDFFRVFHELPELGGVLRAEDDVPNPSAVLLSASFWQNSLGGDPAIVGRRIEVDGKQLRVVGVMPASFAFPNENTAFWVPMGLSAGDIARRGARSVQGVARVRRGVALSSAAAMAARTGRVLAEQFPKSNGGWSILVRELRTSRVAGVRTILLFVWGAGALVLLIAVANVASLLLTRAVARERELALRAALGARTGRLLRQLLTEAFVLATLSAAAGIGIAFVVIGVVRPAASGFVARMGEVAIGGRAVAYAALLALATTMLLSLFAASAIRGNRLWSALATSRSGASRRRRRVQRAIVIAEVALAVFVLVGGALAVRTLTALLSQPMGFEPRARLTFRIEPPWRVDLADTTATLGLSLASDRQRANAGYDALRARLEKLPGVTAVGAVNRLPLTGDWWTSGIRLPEKSSDEKEQMPVYVRAATPGYMEAMGTRIVRGRSIARTDVAGGESIVVVDEELARHAWGDADPIGREIVMSGPPSQPQRRGRVVGVVETIHMSRLDGDLRPTMYVPFSQANEGHYLNWGMDVVLRGNTSLTADELRAAAHEIFPDAVVFRVQKMDEIVARSTADRRFQLLVVGSFGVLALILATVGTGATLLLAVRERREELALRLALGGVPSRLWWDVQRDGLLLATRGAVLGLLVAAIGARIFASVVHGVSARDPVALVGAAVLTLAAAFGAVAVPATLAMRVDPAMVMRE